MQMHELRNLDETFLTVYNLIHKTLQRNYLKFNYLILYCAPIYSLFNSYIKN